MPTELEKRFDNPPRSFSPVPIWWWSGERLDPERLRWQLERFAEGGVYNLVVMNLAPTGPMFGSDPDDPPFFSEEWWEIFRGVCEDAGRLGISIWFYDQIGFSGANLQAEIVKGRPEFSGRWLERAAREMSESGTLESPAGGKVIAGAAVPIDDHGAPVGEPVPVPVQDGRVEWDGTGKHRVMLFYSVERGFDYFSPTACRILIDRVHGGYEAHVGDHFGTTIVGSFQDELPSMPTWSQNFAEQFEKRCGYDLVPHLAALWEEYGDKAKWVRRDFHITRAAISEETLFKPLFDWHEDRGLICGFDQQDPVRAGYPIESVDRYADYQRTHRWFGAPGSDHHGDAKIHSSLAHLYGRPRTWIEAFHSSGWGGTLEETFDWLLPWLRAGANLYDPHAVYYSTRGGWWEWAPPSTDWRQPYWEHYNHFSRTVSRLCSVLTLGHHVCDAGVLFPTATVQAGLRLDGPEDYAKTAHETYLKIAGTMPWYEVEPGALDHASRDFDVLDDDSIQRSSTEDGLLRIGDERYTMIVLPGCRVLEANTASKLVSFVERGGLLIAVGEVPRSVVGTDRDQGAAEALASLFDQGRAHRLSSPDDLVDFLAGVPRRVDAPFPTLMRRIGEATVLFVPAAFPRATELRMHGRRGTEGGWLDIDYDFDPSAYYRRMDIKVKGIQGTPMLWEPYSGRKRPLESSTDDSGMEVRVPFDDGPGVLVVWDGSRPGGESAETAGVGEGNVDVSESTMVRSEIPLDDVWTVELEPTLDNRWGDFARPVETASLPVERWEFRHKTEQAGEDGESVGWARPEFDDSDWGTVLATFGPHGRWTGPVAPDMLPSPAQSGEEARESLVGDGREPGEEWRPASYSLSRGIYKDRIHQGTLGPTGHVPEEFLDFGRVARGEAVQFRTTVSPSASLSAHFALGAPARKRVWINGAEIPSQDGGYLVMVPVTLDEGLNVVEFRLEAEDDVELRAHFAFVHNPERYNRPELIRAGDRVRKDTAVSYEKKVSVPFRPEKVVVQVGSDAPCRVYVNGVQVGRQGGFDPYFELHQARIQPYDVTAQTREGENEIKIEVSDLGVPHAVSVDGLFEAEGNSVSLVSDETWQVTRDGEPVSLDLRRQPFGSIFPWGDPALPHLWRRPHPLPGSSWLEDAEGVDDVVVGLAPDARAGQHRVEWLRFLVPPGATHMQLAVHGTATVYLNGEERVRLARGGDAAALQVELPRAGEPERVCALRVETEPGHEAGAILDGPVRFVTGVGSMSLGDWEDRGLAGYSGGVRYRRRIEWVGAGEEEIRLLLDLGRVRGTAEVLVNGVSTGVRLWFPYTFDLTGHLSTGENDLEVRIFNTIGPYLDAVSPTRFVFEGQRVSGLMGPVKILEVEG
jgi:hypothetical protein